MPPFSLSWNPQEQVRLSSIWEECLRTIDQKQWILGASKVPIKSSSQSNTKVNERHFMQTEWGESPIFLLPSAPCENQSALKALHTIGPAAGAIRQFISEMTFLMRNTCWKRTKGLVWSEGCSRISSEVQEKVISFTHPTPSGGISSAPDVGRHRCWTNGANVLRFHQNK